jgi:hypothetical protein
MISAAAKVVAFAVLTSFMKKIWFKKLIDVTQGSNRRTY